VYESINDLLQLLVLLRTMVTGYVTGNFVFPNGPMPREMAEKAPRSSLAPPAHPT
jgi:hypothetical protein